jgi:large subunit ribosomal protein L13Ae
MARLTVVEGVPSPYDKVKKQVIPGALKSQKLAPGRKFTRVGDLATLAGWKHNELVAKLEAKRLVKAAAWYNGVVELNKLKAQAVAETADALKDTNAKLAVLGY